MINWWSAMSVFEQILASLGIVSILMLVLQIIIMLFGAIGEGGANADSGDIPDLDSGAGPPDGADFSADFDGDFGGDFSGDFIPDAGGHIEAGHTSHYAANADSGDLLSNAQTGLRLFTMQGIVCFLAIFSWSGLLMIKSGIHTVISVIIAAALGFIAMFIMAALMRFMLKLQYDGTSDIRSALGKVGTVYLTIPAKRSRAGKVSLIVQDTLMELEAVTDEEENIPTGSQVFVSGISGRNTLLVKRK